MVFRSEEWQAAMQALILVAEHDGPTIFARIGVMKASRAHVAGDHVVLAVASQRHEQPADVIDPFADYGGTRESGRHIRIAKTPIRTLIAAGTKALWKLQD
jgi:hypothetical protein